MKQETFMKQATRMTTGGSSDEIQNLAIQHARSLLTSHPLIAYAALQPTAPIH